MRPEWLDLTGCVLRLCLAPYDTSWGPYRDKHMYRLVCYMCSTLDDLQEGHSSQRAAIMLNVVAYADAAFVRGAMQRRVLPPADIYA